MNVRGSCKCWTFTINNPSPSDESRLEGLSFSYLIYGRETGALGTPHLQGYVQWAKKKSFKQVQEMLPHGAHIEKARGSPDSNRVYCSKDGDYVEVGSMAFPGQRSDLDEIRQRIVKGESMCSIAEDSFASWCVYRRAFQEYAALLHPPRFRPNLRVFLIVGNTGTGKTGVPHVKYDGHIFKVPSSDLKWFDGYANERVALIDDYSGGAPRDFLLQLLDIYKMQVPIKGGFVPWNPDIIVITTNSHVCSWGYDYYEAIERRIDTTLEWWTPLDFADTERVEHLQSLLPDLE